MYYNNGPWKKRNYQSKHKNIGPKSTSQHCEVFRPPDKSDETKINLQEDALKFMKNMNKQELVDFLMSNDDWHVKTSGINASGS